MLSRSPFNSESKWLAALALYAAILFAVFFWTLNTVSSDYSWGDVDYFHQCLFNFWHGRLFQTSLYRIPSNGELASPLAYAHTFTIHVNALHYLLAAPYRWLPYLNTVYACPILYNLLGLVLFALGMSREASPSPETSTRRRMDVVLLILFAALAGGSYYAGLTYKCHPTMYAVPFFLASYVFHRRGHYTLFFACTLAMIFIQEDCAMWAFTYSIYLLIFEKNRHPTVFLTAALSLSFFLFVTAWLQKDAKWYLGDMRFSSDLSYTLHMMFLDKLHDGRDLSLSLLRWAGETLMAFSFLAVLAGGLHRLSGMTRKEFALLVVIPSPFWFSLLIGRGGPHQCLPVICCFLIVIARMGLRLAPNEWEHRLFGRPARGLFLALLAVTYVVSNKTLWLNGYILLRAYGVIPSHAYSPARMRSNKQFLLDAAGVPPGSSLCYWASRNVSAFIAGRSDLWRFPYAFDKADYLAVQKNVTDSFFQFAEPYDRVDLPELAGGNWNTPTFRANKACSSMGPCRIGSEDVDFLKDLLTQKRKSHRVYFEDSDVLILKSVTQAPIERPRFTESWYWR